MSMYMREKRRRKNRNNKIYTSESTKHGKKFCYIIAYMPTLQVNYDFVCVQNWMVHSMCIVKYILNGSRYLNMRIFSEISKQTVYISTVYTYNQDNMVCCCCCYSTFRCRIDFVILLHKKVRYERRKKKYRCFVVQWWFFFFAFSTCLSLQVTQIWEMIKKSFLSRRLNKHCSPFTCFNDK